MKRNESGHFLTRPRTIRGLWLGFSLLLGLTVIAQSVFYVKGYFLVDGWFAFGAVFGFLSCLLMVLFSKALGTVLKRPQDYYRERDGDA
jgi:hypothetical protein